MQYMEDEAPAETLPKGDSTPAQPNTVQVPKDQGYSVGPVGTRGTFEVIEESPDFCTLQIVTDQSDSLAEDDGSSDSALNSVDTMFSKKGTYK